MISFRCDFAKSPVTNNFQVWQPVAKHTGMTSAGTQFPVYLSSNACKQLRRVAFTGHVWIKANFHKSTLAQKAFKEHLSGIPNKKPTTEMIPAIQLVTLWHPDMSINDRKFAERQGAKTRSESEPILVSQKGYFIPTGARSKRVASGLLVLAITSCKLCMLYPAMLWICGVCPWAFRVFMFGPVNAKPRNAFGK